MSNSETREKLKSLIMEAAAEIGMTQFVKENNDHYKGDCLQNSTARKADLSADEWSRK